MITNFEINKIYEQNLEATFNINDGVFENNNDTLVLSTIIPIKNIKELTFLESVEEETDINNYFVKEYRLSFDNLTYTSLVPLNINFSNFFNPGSHINVWFEFRYTFISNGSKNSILKNLNIKGIRNINEIFQPFVITDTPSVFTNQDTYKIYKLTNFTVYFSQGTIDDVNIGFRFTQTQGRTLSELMPLTVPNLQSLKFDTIKFCNFQFTFIKKNTNNVEIYDLELEGEFVNVTANYKTMAKFGLKTQCNPLIANVNDGCCDACSTCETPLGDNSCNICDDKYVNYNNVSLFKSRIDLMNQLNKYKEKTSSLKVTYCLTDPDKNGKNVILNTYSLTNIIDFKDVNIIVPNNQFPIENVNFSGLDMDLIQSFEVHILKETFKNIFGVEFRPSKYDVLYICDLNQLLEVEQMFPARTYMNSEIYYRVILKKYNDRSNRNKNSNTEAKNFLDAVTKYTSLENLFGIEIDEQIQDNTKNNNINLNNNKNNSQFYNSLSTLNIIKTKDKSVSYNNEQILNSSLILSENQYKFPIVTKGNIKFIEYIQTDNVLNLNSNRTISLLFKSEDYDSTLNLNLLNNYKLNNGYKINILNNVLTFSINTFDYTLPLIGFETDTLYCLLININQIQQTIDLVIYKRQNENGKINIDTKLKTFAKMSYTFTPTEFSIDNNIYLGNITTNLTNPRSTPHYYITNLRIFNTSINKTYLNNMLNEKAISKSSQIILSDNAENTLNLPDYGNI